MAVANGRISTSQLTALPLTFSNKNEQEHLTTAAYASLSRMMLRAVADTGSYFSVWDAYRSMGEQVEMLKKNYYPSSSGDRSYGRQRWARRSGRPRTASPGHSNHGNGVAVDIHPGPVQAWLKANAGRFGWVNDVPSEAWHWSYLNPSSDQYRAEGVPDVKGIQKAVGVETDGKYGPATAKAVKAWQKAQGLTADGIPGPSTVAAMLGKEIADAVEDIIDALPGVDTPTSGGFTYTYTREQWDTRGVGGKVHEMDHQTLGVYLHHPGSPGVLARESVAQTMARLRGYRADHVDRQHWFDIGYGVAFDQAGNSYELRGAAMESGANGGSDSNDEAGAFLLLVGNGEDPSPAMISAVNGFLAQYADVFPDAAYIRGHRESPDAKTTCPGDEVMALIGAGAFTYDGKPYARPPAVKPSTPTMLPTGKAALMTLIASPDFPLLRTAPHRCYYGPKSGPRESVSGHQGNTLNPGDVGKSGSDGLKVWQRRMIERGYSIAADGKYGPESENACRNLQKLAGIAADGKVGPDAFYAAWLLPIQ